MKKPIVAVVGRPNVGKSTLFNKLTGRRISIVDDTPGVTRDRIVADCDWNGQTFALVDTGGIEPAAKSGILSQMREQAQLAIDSADTIVFVGDIRTGLLAADLAVVDMLRKSVKPVVVCVNKCDRVGSDDLEFYEFFNLGLGEPVRVSSVHGHGTGDLLDRIVEILPKNFEENLEDAPINVAVIGRPNAGKSSLVNKICGSQRCIVSNVAGTTRDAIDTVVENSFGTFNFIDTAGLRKKARVHCDIEKYSVLRAKMAVERSNVCVLVIDALEGFTDQDARILGDAMESGKACIVAVNKWDALEKDTHTMHSYTQKLKSDLAFASYVPIVFISALTGAKLPRLFETILQVFGASELRISTGRLNSVLGQSMLRVPPPTDRGRRLKIFYITQAAIKPTTFVFFVNTGKLFHFSYQRYLENQLRETFDLTGVPLRFIIREKVEK